jgi:hypothetical protein
VDDFYKKFSNELAKLPKLPCDGKKHRDRSHVMSESEMITILILYHFGSFKSFYLHYIYIHLKKEFPGQLSYNRFIQLEHRVFMPMTFVLNTACFGKCPGITFIDSTKIPVCNNKRIYNNKVFIELAKIGKSTTGWFYGFNLHLVCNDKGELLSFCLTPGNVDDRDPETIKKLTKKLFGKLFGDRGYIPSALFESFFHEEIHLVTGIRSNMKNRLILLYDRILLRKRSVIETMNDELKNICDIEHSRHRSSHDFIVNLIAAPGAYCFFDKKPAIKVDFRPQHGQLALF